MATHLKSEASSLERGLEVLRTVDEKFGSFDIVFLSEFAQEDFGEGSRDCRKEADVKQVVIRL